MNTIAQRIEAMPVRNYLNGFPVKPGRYQLFCELVNSTPREDVAQVFKQFANRVAIRDTSFGQSTELERLLSTLLIEMAKHQNFGIAGDYFDYLIDHLNHN